MPNTISIIAGYLLHLVIGGFDRPYYPAAILRKMIRFYEAKFRAFAMDEGRAGVLLVFSIVFDVFVTSMLLLLLARFVHPLLAFLVSTYFIFGLFSLKALAENVLEFRNGLEAKELAPARESLGRLLRADPGDGDEGKMIGIAVEAIAKETVRGIITPLFYTALGGAALGMAAKAVRILRNGECGGGDNSFLSPACKLDDALNFIPARISPWLISSAAFFTGLKGMAGFREGFRSGPGFPEADLGFAVASFSGALGAELPGLRQNAEHEGGNAEEMRRRPEISDLDNALRLAFFTSFFSLLLALAVQMGVWGAMF